MDEKHELKCCSIKKNIMCNKNLSRLSNSRPKPADFSSPGALNNELHFFPLYLDVVVVVYEGLDGVQHAVGHLVRLVEDEETPLARGHVAPDPVGETQLCEKILVIKVNVTTHERSNVPCTRRPCSCPGSGGWR